MRLDACPFYIYYRALVYVYVLGLTLSLGLFLIQALENWRVKTNSTPDLTTPSSVCLAHAHTCKMRHTKKRKRVSAN